MQVSKEMVLSFLAGLLVSAILLGAAFYAYQYKVLRVADQRNDATSMSNAGNFVQVGENLAQATPDPFSINSAKLEDKVLTLNVSYSGGCGEHSFSVVSDGDVGASDVVKLYVMHNANGDRCESLVTEDLEFDASDLVAKVDLATAKYVVSEYADPATVSVEVK